MEQLRQIRIPTAQGTFGPHTSTASTPYAITHPFCSPHVAQCVALVPLVPLVPGPRPHNENRLTVHQSGGVYASYRSPKGGDPGDFRDTYDAMSRKRSEIIAGTATTLIWDGWDYLQSRAAAAKINFYTLGGSILAQETVSGARWDYLTDALGSVIATQDSTSILGNTYRYKPYGTQLAKTGTSADPVFGWVGALGYRPTGRMYSEQYVRARHFGTTQARWTSRDPLWPRQLGYGYVGGRPSTSRDWTGMIPMGMPIEPQNPFACPTRPPAACFSCQMVAGRNAGLDGPAACHRASGLCSGYSPAGGCESWGRTWYPGPVVSRPYPPGQSLCELYKIQPDPTRCQDCCEEQFMEELFREAGWAAFLGSIPADCGRDITPEALIECLEAHERLHDASHKVDLLLLAQLISSLYQCYARCTPCGWTGNPQFPAGLIS